MNLQQAVFDKILGQFSKKSEAVKTLSNLFQTGQNAIYRRMRGESILTPDELALLAKHFNISLDDIIHEASDNVLFSFTPATQKVKDFTSYLNSLTEAMQPLHEFPNGTVKYAAAEIPVFHYCFFPELIAFKLYTWGKTTWNFDYLKDQPFAFNLISPDTYAAAGRFLTSYLQSKSIELWNLNVLDNTLNQIEYYAESGSIANLDDALLLCDKMAALVLHLKEMAAQGKKFPVGAKSMENRSDFVLFHNEMIFTNNTIIVSTESGKAIFSTLGNPNFIRGTDKRVTQFIEEWFDEIMIKSQPISSHAEKARNQYFNRLVRKVAQTKLRIEAM